MAAILDRRTVDRVFGSGTWGLASLLEASDPTLNHSGRRQFKQGEFESATTSSSVTSATIAATLGVAPSLYVENQMSAVKDSPLPRCPRHCIEARNCGA